MGYSENTLPAEKYISNGPEKTKEIGYHIGKRLKRGDVVALFGELGVGKTTLIKGIAGALGMSDREIASASFTIITEYDTIPRFTHIDLYRIERAEDLNELGLWEYMGDDHISVIEWAEKAGRMLPEGTIKIFLVSTDTHSREITIEGIHEKDRDNR